MPLSRRSIPYVELDKFTLHFPRWPQNWQAGEQRDTVYHTTRVVWGLEALQHPGGPGVALLTTNFFLCLPKQERGHQEGEKQVDIWKQDWQMKQTRQCNGELGHQNERLISHGLEIGHDQACWSSLHQERLAKEEDTKTYRGKRLPILHTQQSLASGSVLPHQTQNRMGQSRELKMKSNKNHSRQMTENEPGLSQIMAGFKRN